MHNTRIIMAIEQNLGFFKTVFDAKEHNLIEMPTSLSDSEIAQELVKLNLSSNFLKKIFDGTANWDIYADADGRLYSIVKPGNSASSSGFGDKNHVLRLMNQNFWSTGSKITHDGLELLSGLHNKLYGELGTSKSWWMHRLA